MGNFIVIGPKPGGVTTKQTRVWYVPTGSGRGSFGTCHSGAKAASAPLPMFLPAGSQSRPAAWIRSGRTAVAVKQEKFTASM